MQHNLQHKLQRIEILYLIYTHNVKNKINNRLVTNPSNNNRFQLNNLKLLNKSNLNNRLQRKIYGPSITMIHPKSQVFMMVRKLKIFSILSKQYLNLAHPMIYTFQMKMVFLQCLLVQFLQELSCLYIKRRMRLQRQKRFNLWLRGNGWCHRIQILISLPMIGELFISLRILQ